MSITIYNDNLGLVKDVRSVDLKSGVQNLWFEGVAGLIDATSVHIRSLDAPKRAARARAELRVRPDLARQADGEIRGPAGRDRHHARRRRDGNDKGHAGGHPERLRVPARERKDRNQSSGPRGAAGASRRGLISKPSLVWMLDASKTKQTVEASYLTGGHRLEGGLRGGPGRR
jgi:hypothetical protein